MISLVFLGLLLVSCRQTLERPTRRSLPFCLTDSTAVIVKAIVRDVVTRTDAYGALYRSPWQLPQLDSSQVSIVNHEPTCHRAAVAFSTAISRPDSIAPVAVIRAGDYFVVSEEPGPATRAIAIVFADSSFAQSISRVGI